MKLASALQQLVDEEPGPTLALLLDDHALVGVELGLDTVPERCDIGLDERGNHSSARDLVTLARVLRTNRFFRTTVDRPEVRLLTGSAGRSLRGDRRVPLTQFRRTP